MWFSGNVYADELSGCTNPLLPAQSWYSPWNGDSTLLCMDAVRAGRERGKGGAQGADPVVVTQQIKWTPPANHSMDTPALVTTPPPTHNRLHQIPEQGSLGQNESGMIMSNEWVMHQEWAAAAAAAACTTCDSSGPLERSYFQNGVATETPSWPGPHETKQHKRSMHAKCEIIHIDEPFNFKSCFIIQTNCRKYE